MAIKGCSRQMIVLNGMGSSMFETAYFVVKADASSRRTHSDMMREANRIVEENSFRACSRGARRLPGGVVAFITGALCGAMFTGLIWLIMALILH